MSHFTVIVIGDDHNKQLAPFHEFECTGRDDDYVKDIDITDDAWKDYVKNTTSKIRSPDGEVFSLFDDRFYRDPSDDEKKNIGIGGTGCAVGKDGLFSYASRDWGDGQGYRAKVRDVPAEWESFEELTSSSRTFAEHISGWYGLASVSSEDEIDTDGAHKYGYVLLNDRGDTMRVIKRTNPESKWDWYQVGGGWTGYFKLKEGAAGLIEEGRADQARKGDIDFEAMRDAKEEEAATFYDDFADLFDKDTEFPSWDDIRDKHAALAQKNPGDDGQDKGRFYLDDARAEYQEHPTMKAINARAKEKGHSTWGLDTKDRFCNGDRAAVLSQARQTAISPFAVVYKGKWHETGSMGWWGMVGDEKETKTWEAEFGNLLDSCSDDTLLTLVDCHI